MVRRLVYVIRHARYEHLLFIAPLLYTPYVSSLDEKLLSQKRQLRRNTSL
jgi:hypothetical protein